MPYQILDDAGLALDAHLDIDGRDLVVHSRGGAAGGSNVRNADYREGLRLLLARLAKAGLAIEGGWVDSARVQHLPSAERAIFAPEDSLSPPTEQFRRLSTRMKAHGRTAGGPGGNSTKRIRLRLEPRFLDADARDVLGVTSIRADFRSQERLPADMLGKVGPAHIWRAVQAILERGLPAGYGPSTDFDLLADAEQRLPPKAVFGLAASEALGFEVLPRHFSGGLGTPCFRALEAAGFEITSKGEAPPNPPAPASSDDRDWAEGQPRLVQHLRKERAPGLSRAKKAAFVQAHGRLFCERCEVDPVALYGSSAAEACIEVHHAVVMVQDMEKDHRTRLEDVQCLCANCHRLVHAELKASLRAAGAPVHCGPEVSST